MKFTRSLPAKAIAKAKVPISTVNLKMLTRQRCRNSITMAETTKVAQSSEPMFWAMKSRHSAGR